MGIVRTEAIRLLRTSDASKDFEGQKAFFLKKPALKGYPVVESANVLNSYTFEMQQSFLKPREKSATKQVVPFKVKYCKDVEALKIGQVLAKHAKLIEGDHLRPVLCFCSAENLFLKRYDRFRLVEC